MILVNKGTNPYRVDGFLLPKNEQKEVPDPIAKKFLEIPGVEKYISQAELEKAAKEAEEKVKKELEELKAENAELKSKIAELEKAAKTKETSKK